MTSLPLYIMAGGQSVRFGTQDKARAIYQGVALLTHVARALQPHVTDITVVGRSPGQYEDLGWRTIADQTPDLGPMGGLYTALCDTQAPRILVVSCDLVNPQGAWLELLAEAPKAPAVAFRDHERWHPLFACYAQELRNTLEQRIQRGERAMWRLLEEEGACALALPPQWASMYSINTPDALSSLLCDQAP